MSASALAGIGAALRNVVTRGKLTLTVWHPTRPLLVVTGLAGEVKQKVELLLPYGISAFPAPGGDVTLLQVAGTRDHLVALLDDPALRIPDLAQGEWGMRDALGQQVVFRADRVEITTSLKVVVTAPIVEVHGDLHVTGAVIAGYGTGDAVNLLTHTHADQDEGDTGAPTPGS